MANEHKKTVPHLTLDGKKLVHGGNEYDMDFLAKVAELRRAVNIEDLLTYFYVLKEYTIETYDVAELVGVNLVGKTLRLFYPNWEDSEWVYGEGIETIAHSELEGYHVILNPLMKAYEEAETDEEYDSAVRALKGAKLNPSSSFVHMNLNAIRTIDVLTPR